MGGTPKFCTGVASGATARQIPAGFPLLPGLLSADKPVQYWPAATWRVGLVSATLGCGEGCRSSACYLWHGGRLIYVSGGWAGPLWA
jgi:hypothetical protein